MSASTFATRTMSTFRDARPGYRIRVQKGLYSLSVINYRFKMKLYRLVGDHLQKIGLLPMTSLGSTARSVRESLGMTQRAAAEALGVSAVHLSNVERSVAPPSASLISRFTEVYGVDVYVLSYCTGEEDDEVPEGVKQARRKLGEALRRQLGDTVKSG